MVSLIVSLRVNLLKVYQTLHLSLRVKMLRLVGWGLLHLRRRRTLVRRVRAYVWLALRGLLPLVLP